jgi:hypothetical protein
MRPPHLRLSLRPGGRRGRRAVTVCLAAAAVVAPTSLAAFLGSGNPLTGLPMAGGGAWLASPGVGLVTLVDGPSEQVAATLAVPVRRGDRVDVTQAGSSAYVADDSTGVVVRIDGATLSTGEPTRFGKGVQGVDVATGGGNVYVVDVGSRTANLVDPGSLHVRDRQSLAARPGAGQSVVDDTGRLWVLDSAGGGLAWVDRGVKGSEPTVGTASDRLTLAGGRPVLVDVQHGQVGWVGDDGSVGDWSCLDVRGGDDVQLLPSSTQEVVYAAVRQSGTLVGARVGQDDCGFTVAVGKPGDALGGVTQSGRYVFVPNRTDGVTYVVDTQRRRVAGTFKLAKPGHQLELIPQDALVFYNDLDSQVAGVLTLQGEVWTRGKALNKYNPAHPGADVITPPNPNTALPPPPAKPKNNNTGNTPDAPSPTPPANPPPANPPPGNPFPTSPPPVNLPRGNPPPIGTPPSSQRPHETGSPPLSETTPVVTAINARPSVVVGGSVTFTATVRDPQGAWKWTLSDGAGAALGTFSDEHSLTFTIPEALEANDELVVRLTVGASAPFRKSFTVAPKPLIKTATSVVTDPAQPSTVEPVTLTVTVTAESGGPPPGQVTVTLEVPDQSPTTLGPASSSDGSAQFPLEPLPAGSVTATATYTPDDTTIHAPSTKATTITITDKCHLVVDGSATLDVRAVRSVDTARVRLVDCPPGQNVTWTRSSWVGFRGSSGSANEELVIDQVSDAPVDEAVNDDAVIAELDNGARVSFGVRGNNAPVWNNYAVCIGPNPTWFYADFLDGDLADLDVEITVGSVTHRMDYVNGGAAGHGEFFGLQWPTGSPLAKVTNWTVKGTDRWGLVSDVGTGQRDSCW